LHFAVQFNITLNLHFITVPTNRDEPNKHDS